MLEQSEELQQTKKDSTKIFKVDELNRALFDIEDVFDRCMTPFYVLKNTAKNIFYGQPLDGDLISVGIEKKYMTPEVMSTLNTYLAKREETPHGFKYMKEEVPIEVTVIKKKYSFFSNPDRKFYWGGDYLIANPFDEYYKSRFLVQ